MRPILIAIAGVILVVWGICPAMAQTEPADTVTLAYSKSDGISDQLVQNFIRQLTANLEQHNIQLEVEDYACCAPPTSFSVRFDTLIASQEYGLINVYTRPDTDPLAAVSWLLANNGGHYRIASPEQETVPADFMDFVTGISLYTVDRCDLADPYFERAIAGSNMPEQLINILLFRGNCAILQQDYEAAIEFFTDAVAIPVDESGHMSFSAAANLGWVYIQIGQPDQGLDIIAASIAPENGVDLCVYDWQTRIAAELYATAGRYDGAASYLTQYITCREDMYPEDMAQRAWYYAMDFQYDKAIADMNVAIVLDPTNPQWYVLRGQMVLLTYEWDQVLADYNQALELDPDYADAYFYRGVLFYTQGPRENALTDFERYLELVPDGHHADQASDYAESIRVELAALNG